MIYLSILFNFNILIPYLISSHIEGWALVAKPSDGSLYSIPFNKDIH